MEERAPLDLGDVVNEITVPDLGGRLLIYLSRERRRRKRTSSLNISERRGISPSRQDATFQGKSASHDALPSSSSRCGRNLSSDVPSLTSKGMTPWLASSRSSWHRSFRISWGRNCPKAIGVSSPHQNVGTPPRTSQRESLNCSHRSCASPFTKMSARATQNNV